VNPGTWGFSYTLAQFYETGGPDGYIYTVNAVNYNSGNWDDSSSSAVTAAYDAFEQNFYLVGSITIATNPGTLFQNGSDRHYVMTLGYTVDETTITYSGTMLSPKSVIDNGGQLIKVFSTDRDTITLTLNKTPVVGAPNANKNMEKVENLGLSSGGEAANP
jgi:hypothetical protein